MDSAPRGPMTTAPLGPLDGRYRTLVEPLPELLSEWALNRERLVVEAEWLIHLADERIAGLTPFDAAQRARLRAVAQEYDDHTVAELQAIEDRTRHDVKAVEYLLKRRMAGTDLADAAELVHFCCTSEDINNLAWGRLVRRALDEVWLPAVGELRDALRDLAVEHRDVPMLARTHGQAATPTTLGKELAVMAHRLGRQLRRVERQEILGKLNGATGTYAAHVVACPDVDWPAVSRRFVERLGLVWNPLTTQVESHDWMSELFDDVARVDRIVADLAVDVWLYVSLGYFRQPLAPGEIGSSTMPHKVNPIRFENAEANTEVANALLRMLSEQLVTSRLQRDLSDSSLQRVIGTALGHSLVALRNATAGLRGLAVDHDALARDLDGAWEVLAEAVQSVLRANRVDEPYERLKELTSGQRINRARLHRFVDEQEIDPDDAARLRALTPATYTGLAAELVRHLE